MIAPAAIPAASTVVASVDDLAPTGVRFPWHLSLINYPLTIEAGFNEV